MEEREVRLRVTYDAEADAAYIYLTDHIPAGGVAYTSTVDDRELRDAVNLDVSHDGELVGIELLGGSLLSRHLRRLLGVPEEG